MKKMIALVLSLALALSLCTVAFALEDGDILYGGQTSGAEEYKYVAAGEHNIAYLVDENGNYYAIGGAGGKTLWIDGLTKADITLGKEINDVESNAKATTTKTDKTDIASAKTFDAGIALYAGMALMSVAGSAVVIGKKKAF